MGVRLVVVPLELKEANLLVAQWHRHHHPDTGHRFSLGVVTEDGRLCGAAIVGRPKARMVPKTTHLEVTRCVTDGTRNACSCLYGAAARVGKQLGYEVIQTYILLDRETGVSLRASGWEFAGAAGGGQWEHSDGKPRRTDQPTGKKGKWWRRLNPAPPVFARPVDVDREEPLVLSDELGDV